MLVAGVGFEPTTDPAYEAGELPGCSIPQELGPHGRNRTDILRATAGCSAVELHGAKSGAGVLASSPAAARYSVVKDTHRPAPMSTSEAAP